LSSCAVDDPSRKTQLLGLSLLDVYRRFGEHLQGGKLNRARAGSKAVKKREPGESVGVRRIVDDLGRILLELALDE
jgi:hypothetical protein